MGRFMESPHLFQHQFVNALPKTRVPRRHPLNETLQTPPTFREKVDVLLPESRLPPEQRAQVQPRIRVVRLQPVAEVAVNEVDDVMRLYPRPPCERSPQRLFPVTRLEGGRDAVVDCHRSDEEDVRAYHDAEGRWRGQRVTPLRYGATHLVPVLLHAFDVVALGCPRSKGLAPRR